MRTLPGRQGLVFSFYRRDSVALAGQLPWLGWALSLSPLSLPSCLLPSFSVGCQLTLIRKDNLGMGSVWQEKSRMDLWGRPSSLSRSTKAESQDGARCQGNSGGCWSWQRRPWHLTSSKICV